MLTSQSISDTLIWIILVSEFLKWAQQLSWYYLDTQNIIP